MACYGGHQANKSTIELNNNIVMKRAVNAMNRSDTILIQSFLSTFYSRHDRI